MIDKLKVLLDVMSVMRGPRSHVSLFVFILKLVMSKIFNKKSLIGSNLLYLGIGKNVASCYVNEWTELALVSHIFCHNEYKLGQDIIRDPKIIFDLGSNSGIASIYFHLLYPDALIFSVEANPKIFDRLKKNCLNVKNIKIYNAVISSKTGTASFFVNKSSLSSSVFERFGNTDEIKIRSYSIPDLMNVSNVSNIDILKFDVEGSEFDIFENWNPSGRVKVLIGEIHSDMFPQHDPEYFMRLIGNNFDLKNNKVLRDGRYLATWVSR